ncbi:histidine phosphatase family protein [Mesorhizobium sp. Pch-S]|uniref:histidine phosphatase family protein n=1 Tax=Mesorhizobium sp. Pch-S TaxID=2082387 RepID=UPI0010136A4C|nr:histidine phosphatase family protein [Mesorhizobium sp. Pch-S]QAZ44107.1 histidine phosphatase family protein [Mesorhizobium sp. Pch-S]
MKNLFVITHTQSLHHIERKVGGWYDTGLTQRGRDDASKVAEHLASSVGVGSAEIFSSDLLRASQTAGIIAARLQCPLELTGDLREMSYGSAEGKPQTWLDERQIPPPDDDRLDHRGGIANGETRRELAERVFQCVGEISQRPCETQIIVTHGFALTFVVAAWIRMPIEACGHVSFRASPGSITHLQQDGYWRNRAVVSLADTTHLK